MSRVAPRKIGDLELRVESNNSRVLLSLAGKVTIDSSPDLRDQLLALLRDVSLEQVTVHLMGVSYFDRSGIATLLEALRLARASNTRLLLTGMQERPRYLLEVTGLLSFFEEASIPSQDATQKGNE